MKLDVVAGAQYGSEAKGHAVQALAAHRVKNAEPLRVIRVAGPNAGHTGHDATGNPWALRQVPVAAVVPGPITLEIAAGSEIDLPVLIDELKGLDEAGLLAEKTIEVHPEATLIQDRHKETEAEMTGRIGSTAKGIGAARADRLMRRAQRLQDCDRSVLDLMNLGVRVQAPKDRKENIIIEGTQGYALGLHAGRYPYCTSSNTRAIDFLAMAGIAPWCYRYLTVWMVARYFPIRVAGNSGPMKGETSWDELGLDPEYTTVTHKQRRVGQPDWDLVREAVEANGGPHEDIRLALFMLDQAHPEVAGDTQWPNLIAKGLGTELDQIGQYTGARVSLAGTGPNSHVWMEQPR